MSQRHKAALNKQTDKELVFNTFISKLPTAVSSLLIAQLLPAFQAPPPSIP